MSTHDQVDTSGGTPESPRPVTPDVLPFRWEDAAKKYQPKR